MYRFVLFILLFIGNNVFAEMKDTIRIDENFKYLELGDSIEYITCKKDEINIQDLISNDEIVYKQHKGELLLFSEKDYQEDLWLKLNVKNNLKKDKRIFLHVDNSLINYLEFFEVRNQNVVQHELTGDAFPVSGRSIKYRNPLFSLKLAPNEQSSLIIHIKLGGRKVHIPMQLYSHVSIIERIAYKESNLAFYYGILVALSVLSLMFFYLIKEKVYIYFASYLTSQTLLQLSVSGFALVYIWPDFTFWSDRSVPILMSITIISGLSFALEFIDKNILKNWQIFIIRAYQFISVLIIIGSFFEGNIYYGSVWLLYRLIPPFYFGLIVLAIYFFSKKYFPARFFVLGLFGSLISILAILYYSTTKAHENIFTNDYVIFGEVLKCSMITLALLDRFRFYKEEKDKIQSIMIEQLEELNRYKEDINKNLSILVDQKTKELNQKQNEVKKALLIGEEIERKRVATELHDGIGSLLSTLKLNAESIDLDEKDLNDKEKQAYKNLIELIDKACVELRNISHNMMPAGIEQFGIFQTLETIIKKINNTERIKFSFEQININERFNRDLELSIYRIILELLNNIIKHSSAKNANIQVIKNDELVNIIVEDDGKGFDVNNVKYGMGFVNIQSRVEAFGGKLVLDSKPFRGCTIIIEIPIIYEKF